MYILALEMASPENQHCANCIGALSFPIQGAVRQKPVYLKLKRHEPELIKKLVNINSCIHCLLKLLKKNENKRTCYNNVILTLALTRLLCVTY